MGTLIKISLVISISMSSLTVGAAPMDNATKYAHAFSRGFSGESMPPNEAQEFAGQSTFRREILAGQNLLEQKAEEYMATLTHLTDLWTPEIVSSQQSKTPETFGEWLSAEPQRQDAVAEGIHQLNVAEDLQEFFNDLEMLFAAVRNGHTLVAVRQLDSVVSHSHALQARSFYFEKKNSGYPRFSKFLSDFLLGAARLTQPRTATEAQRFRDFQQALQAWSQGGWKQAPFTESRYADDISLSQNLRKLCRVGAHLCTLAPLWVALPLLGTGGDFSLSSLSDTIGIVGGLVAAFGASVWLIPSVVPRIDRALQPKHKTPPSVTVFANQCQSVLDKSLR